MAGAAENNQDAVLDEAVEQFLAARLRGEEPDLEQYVRQHPGLEKQIRQKVQNCQRVSSLFDSLRGVDESEFQHAEDEVDLIGKRVGVFKIIEVIGRGGMGVVYKGHDTRLDRFVAIKAMPGHLLEDATAQARFRREAKLLASLNHNNIAVIYDIIEQEVLGYLVLEYIPGQTLAERITKGPLKLQEALTIALQIAEAVASAHEHDVIHRDLKPGNIKITPDGRVKVLDFGLAKAVGDKAVAQQSTVTQPGRVMGTPAYMSPEQARGKSTDHHTDIWSFGCIMYEMLSGHLPFEGETATDTLARIIERQPDWEALPQEIPTNIRVLLQRCLEKDPERRLGNIADAAIEISDTLNKPTTAQPTKLRRIAMIISIVVIGIILSGIALKFIPQKEIQLSPKDIRLVVLPFENLGPDNDEYFADSITDEITSQLAPIRGLFVLSPRTAVHYKKGEKNAPQIGKELSVDYILEGIVQRERPSEPTSRIRVTARLIRASEDRLVLQPIYPIYNEDMNELFQMQSDLAQRIVQALDITLLEPQRLALQSRPTENIEAHKYYLQGNKYYNRSYLESDSRIAIRMYETAVELDPTFALAYARLSRIHSRMYMFPYDRSEERLALAKQAVDEAFQLDPGLPEAHLALGFYHYWGHLDYDDALKQFAIARKSQPNNSSLLSGIGWVQRRQGKFEQALANLKRAYELDPLSALLMEQIGETFLLLRKYPEAERYFNMAIWQDPNVPTPYGWKVRLYLLWEGSIERAREVLAEALENIELAEDPFIAKLLVMLDVYGRNYQEALNRLSLKSEDIDSVFSFIPNALRCAQIYRYMGNNQKAKEYYEQAIDILKSKIAEDPNDARFHSSLGIAYAGLGRTEDAIKEGKLGVKLLPVSNDAWGGLYRVRALAEIYVMVDEYDKAFEQLEFLLSIPSEMSIHLFRLDPAWDPLRDHSRFKKLIGSGK